MPEIARPALPALTSIRFVAALHVVFVHYLLPSFPNPPTWLLNIVSSGQSSVSLFFILSGFVLMYSQTRPDGTLIGTPRSFWLSRFARIYPIYLVALVLTAPTLHARLSGGVIQLVPEGILSALMLQSWVPQTDLVFNSPGWSISVEMCFYLLFPVICAPLARFSARRSVLLLFALYACAVLPRAIYAAGWYPPPDAPQGFLDPGHKVLTTFPLMRLPEFLTGMLLARLLGDRAADVSRRYRGLAPTMLVLGCIAAIVALHVVTMPTPFRFVMTWLMLPLLALLVGSLAVTNTVVGRVLEHPLPVLLGTISYSFYILQVPVYALERLAFGMVLGVDRYWVGEQSWFFVVYLITLVVASMVSYFWFERPVRAFLQRTNPAPRQAAIPVSDTLTG